MIVRATTDDQILATRDVMLELRPAVPAEAYVSIVRRMMQTDGYQLAALYVGDTVRAVAGYRVMEMLSCGRILYVDDLNTRPDSRSGGHGKALMDWLKHEAKTQGCTELHLDSGVQRAYTHRFYFRERLTVNCFHFSVPLVD